MVEHHFFISTLSDWCTAPTMLEAINKLPKCSLDSTYVMIFRVPLPENAEYHINNFAPQVEGAELIYTANGGDDDLYAEQYVPKARIEKGAWRGLRLMTCDE